MSLKELSVLTWPQLTGLLNEDSDMQRTLFHLRSQVQGCGNEQIRIGRTNLYLAIKPSKVDLRCSKDLLSDGRIHSLTEFGQFCQSVSQCGLFDVE